MYLLKIYLAKNRFDLCQYGACL